MNKLISLSLVSMLIVAVGCEGPAEQSAPVASNVVEEVVQAANEPRPDVYADFSLATDLSALNEGQRQMLVLFIEASQIMDDLFWRQAYGDDYPDWLASIGVDETRRFAELNYGPWDRLDDEAPFMEGAGEKPLGARFYPADMTKEEFEAAELAGRADLYSFVRRNEQGELTLVPYHVEYAAELRSQTDQSSSAEPF